MRALAAAAALVSIQAAGLGIFHNDVGGRNGLPYAEFVAHCIPHIRSMNTVSEHDMEPGLMVSGGRAEDVVNAPDSTEHENFSTGIVCHMRWGIRGANANYTLNMRPFWMVVFLTGKERHSITGNEKGLPAQGLTLALFKGYGIRFMRRREIAKNANLNVKSWRMTNVFNRHLYGQNAPVGARKYHWLRKAWGDTYPGSLFGLHFIERAAQDAPLSNPYAYRGESEYRYGDSCRSSPISRPIIAVVLLLFGSLSIGIGYYKICNYSLPRWRFLPVIVVGYVAGAQGTILLLDVLQPYAIHLQCR